MLVRVAPRPSWASEYTSPQLVLGSSSSRITVSECRDEDNRKVWPEQAEHVFHNLLYSTSMKPHEDSRQSGAISVPCSNSMFAHHHSSSGLRPGLVGKEYLVWAVLRSSAPATVAATVAASTRCTVSTAVASTTEAASSSATTTIPAASSATPSSTAAPSHAG